MQEGADYCMFVTIECVTEGGGVASDGGEKEGFSVPFSGAL